MYSNYPFTHKFEFCNVTIFHNIMLYVCVNLLRLRSARADGRIAGAKDYNALYRDQWRRLHEVGTLTSYKALLALVISSRGGQL